MMSEAPEVNRDARSHAAMTIDMAKAHEFVDTALGPRQSAVAAVAEDPTAPG
jgi:hypothetical protein